MHLFVPPSAAVREAVDLEEEAGEEIPGPGAEGGWKARALDAQKVRRIHSNILMCGATSACGLLSPEELAGAA